MIAYYNEIDAYAAQWLRNLIGGGHIAPGDVDERSIVDVQPDDLKGYRQCHFFAGIGGWSFALRLAGWTDDRPVWTGSCPCQPLSSAGQRKGHADERHLWPAFHDLISECGPATVFGEQVASADGREWFAAVRADLEALGYACGSADLCAAGVGAPHIRQRLYWVAQSEHGGREAGQPEWPGAGATLSSSAAGGLADAIGLQDYKEQQRPQADERKWSSDRFGGCGSFGGMADAGCERRDGEQILLQRWGSQQVGAETAGNSGDSRPSPTDGFWRDADWLGCRDGKWRPVEPGAFPLAHGVSARVGRLRAYGNAIVPALAAKFIAAFMECRP